MFDSYWNGFGGDLHPANKEISRLVLKNSEWKEVTAKNRWIVVFGFVTLFSPIAVVCYSDAFLELSDTFIAFPWFSYSLDSMSVSIHGTDFNTLNGTTILIVGIVWTLLGCLLVPVTRIGMKRARWPLMIVSSLSVLVLQSLITIYGFSQTTYQFYSISMLPLPIPSLLSLLFVIIQYRLHGTQDDIVERPSRS
jgi:hypothetical protein